jgi:hypothetical protein
VQAMRMEAELFGVTTEEVDSALTKFSINLGKARQGAGDLSKIFAQYNQSLIGSDTEVLERYIGLLQRASSAAEQNRIAVAGFGKAGAKLAQSIAESNLPLGQMVQKFKDLGLVMDEQGIRKLGELNDQFDRLAQQGTMALKQFVVGAVRELETLGTGFSRLGQLLSHWASGDFIGIDQILKWEAQATQSVENVKKAVTGGSTADASGVGDASEDFQKYLANLNKAAMTENQLRVEIWKKYGEEANAVRKGDEEAAIAAQSQQEELFKQLAQSGVSKTVLAEYAKIVGEIKAKPISVSAQIKMDPDSYRALSLGMKEALTAGGAEIVTVPIKPYIVWGDVDMGGVSTLPAGQGITREVDQTGATP